MPLRVFFLVLMADILLNYEMHCKIRLVDIVLTVRDRIESDYPSIVFLRIRFCQYVQRSSMRRYYTNPTHTTPITLRIKLLAVYVGSCMRSELYFSFFQLLFPVF